MNANTRLKKLPTFESAEEEDQFWQTHSPLDYEHELVKPQGNVSRTPKHGASAGMRPTTPSREPIRKGGKSRQKTPRPPAA